MTVFARFLGTCAVCATAWLSASAAAGPLVVDGEGNVLGMFVERGIFGGAGGPVPPGGYNVPYDYTVLSETSYLFSVRIPSADGVQYPPRLSPNEAGSVYYDSDDCSGLPYVAARNNVGGAVFAGAEAYLATPPSSIPLFYVPRNAEAVEKSNLSRASGWGCQQTSGPLMLLPSLPNDPSVTGVSNATPSGPIVLKHPADPAVTGCLFRDTFESCN